MFPNITCSGAEGAEESKRKIPLFIHIKSNKQPDTPNEALIVAGNHKIM